MRNALLTLLLFGLLSAHANPAAFYEGLTAARLRGNAVVNDPFDWSNLVGYYALDGNATCEVTGTNGVWEAGVITTNDAISGSAASLNKATNSYVTLANASLLNGKAAISISFWLKQRTHQDYAGLVTARGAKLNGLAQKDSNAARIYQFYGMWNNVFLPVFNAASPRTIATNQWQHLALVKTSTNVTTYLNGTIYETTNYTGNVEQNAAFIVGYDTAATTRKTDGIFDEVAFFDRALSSNEVYRISTEQLIYRAP
jgi:hypothetical protein